jgi:glyoxylase-like metal-dependent hydrolase (beta-lactamase superfamily II)
MAWLLAVPLAAQVSFDVAIEGDLDEMKAMVAEDPSLVVVPSENGKTVLHYAAQGGHTELVAFLIEAGAKINSANDAGETPLHYAAAMGHEDVVRVLLEHGASAVAVDSSSNTPLHFAAYSGSVAIARMLISNGADVNAVDFYGYHPLDLAAGNEQRELSDFLEKEGGTMIVIEDPEVVQVSGPVYRIRFPFGDVSNIGLSAGDDGFLLVDTGFSARAMDKLREAMSSLGAGELKMIVNTHLHPDHIAGNSIGGDGVRIIDFNNLDQMAADGVLTAGGGPIEGRSGKSFPVFYTMRFNGEEIRLIPYPGIHTDADLLVHFTRSGVVHIGDLLILQSFPSVTRRAGDYLEFLETVVDVFPESTRLICGHGREGTIADVEEYHRELSAAAEIIKTSLAQGKTKRAILTEESLQPYESWAEFIPVLNTEYWFNAVAADFKEKTDFTE